MYGMGNIDKKLKIIKKKFNDATLITTFFYSYLGTVYAGLILISFTNFTLIWVKQTYNQIWQNLQRIAM